MTDVLGVCESWDDGRGRRTTRAGRPGRDRHRRHRLGQAGAAPALRAPPPRPGHEADRLALPGWQPVESEPLGEWVLRASGGFSSRGNSVLALGDPGLPLDEAVERVAAVVRRPRRSPPRAHVHPASPAAAAFAAAGWTTYEPTLLMLGVGVAGCCAGSAGPTSRSRHARRRSTRAGWPATSGPPATASRPGRSSRPARSPSRPCATRTAPCSPAGAARSTATGSGSPRCGPARTRGARAWAAAVLRSLLEWGAERGATTTYLQVVVANTAAQELYEACGYEVHHRYDYLVA